MVNSSICDHQSAVEAYGTPEADEAYRRLFPMVPARGSIACRAILDRQTIHVRDMATVPGVSPAVRNLGYKSQIAFQYAAVARRRGDRRGVDDK